MREIFHSLWRSTLPLYLSLAAFVFFSRAWLILAYGSEVPYWDQWGAEAASLYLPWMRGEFDWTTLFSAHNEHRIVLTRLASLVLFAASDRWNIYAELLLNAALHSATAIAVVAALSRSLDGRAKCILIGVTAVLFAGTAGWENALWGFQSQFYFATLFSVVAVSVLIDSVPFSMSWWWGWAAAGLALFSNAAGVLASLAALLVIIFVPRADQNDQGKGRAISLVGILVTVGLLLRVEPVQHEVLHAHTIPHFVSMLARCLAWPHVDRGWLCAVIQLPIVCLVVYRWKRREHLISTERCAVGFVLLTLLGAAAIAYSRGDALKVVGPLSRYQDLFLPAIVAQIFALTKLARLGWYGRLLTIGWAGLLAVGILSLAELNLGLELPRKRALDNIGRDAIREYLATGNSDLLLASGAALGRHPTVPTSVQQTLDEVQLREVLPAELLQPPNTPLSPRPWILVYGKIITALSAIALALTLCAVWIRTRVASLSRL